MQKTIIECIRIAAAAENLTEAKRNAKAQGLNQAETARQYKRISERREEKRAFQRILLRKAWLSPKITMHDNINRRNFRRRAMFRVVDQRLMPFFCGIRIIIKLRSAKANPCVLNIFPDMAVIMVGAFPAIASWPGLSMSQSRTILCSALSVCVKLTASLALCFKSATCPMA